MAGLVDRLRSLKDFTCDEAADRIEELESKLSAKTGEALFHQERTIYLENRIAALEAEKAELRKAMTDLADGCDDTCARGYCVLDDPEFQTALGAVRAALQPAGELGVAAKDRPGRVYIEARAARALASGDAAGASAFAERDGLRDPIAYFASDATGLNPDDLRALREAWGAFRRGDERAHDCLMRALAAFLGEGDKA